MGAEFKDKLNDRYGLYLHIPFCRQKCYYCDFPSLSLAGGREKLMKPYVEALCKDIELWHSGLTMEGYGTPATIYIGGGTPTALPDDLLELLLAHVREIAFPWGENRADLEYTVEVNPCTATLPKLQLLRSYGVNRLSIGVQTFNDGCLERIGRIHSSNMALQAVAMAKKAGFKNISIDLMYGLPMQSIDDFKENVAIALDLPIQHISIYGLQVEEGTVFGKMQEQGRLQLPSEEESEAMYDYLAEVLPKAGFHRYEISNFARKGYESRHNLSYWQDVPYIGLGAGAHAYWQGQRYQNTFDVREYIEKVNAGETAWEIEEVLTEKEHMEEFCFLALRTAEGINRQRFQQVFGNSIDDVYGNVLAEQEKYGLLAVDEYGARLTELGMKYGNQVFQEFLL